MKYLNTAFALVLSAAVMSPLKAAEEPEDPAMQTSWGLYIDSMETAAMKEELGDQMLFVDVRDPVEIMFTGFTDMVDINIPFKLVDTSAWQPEKPAYSLRTNPDFEQEIAAALEARGLSKEAPIAIMCRSGGTRGAPSTRLLEGKGYENVYVVVDGFEGGTIKEGDKKGFRLKNGWKNSGLPWSYELNKEKMYLSAQ